MIKKQLIIVVCCLAVIALLLCAYAFIISPLLNREEEVTPIELEEGEALYGKDSVLLYEQYSESEIDSVFVHNSYGDFEFYRFKSSEGSQFVIRGKETAPYDRSKFSVIITAVDCPFVKERIKDVKDYSQYGLDPDSKDLTYYVMKTTSGKTYKVYIGDIAPSNAGYYCRVDGREDIVYLMDTSLETFSNSINYYIAAYLAMPTTQDDYYAIDNFRFTRDGETVIAVDYLTESEREKNGSSSFYRITYPTGYNIAYSNYESVLKLFMNFVGSEVLEFELIGTELPGETMEKYRLTEPKYRLSFSYSGIPNEISISDKNEDGTYYAYSSLYNIICKLDASKMGFLEWDRLKFLNTALFATSIYDIASVQIESERANETFLMSGDDKETEFVVTAKSSGKSINVDYYRQYYMNILTLYLRGYSEYDDADSLECSLTMTITTKLGVKTVYKFYPYSTSHCYYTINGVGEFYLLRDEVDKLINNTERLMKGEPVSNAQKD